MSNLETTVGEMVVQRPGRARVFEKLGIDYCCGGKKPLELACRDKGLDTAAVLRQLAEAEQERSAVEQDWAARSLTDLTRHIEQTHHAYLKQELPWLDQISQKVALVHGKKHPEMLRVREIFVNFKAELDSHMMKEEQILFPLCRGFESQQALPNHCGSVRNPIRVMIAEHDDAGAALEQFRGLTHDYTPPAEACNTYRALLEGLRQLELDMHQHVHKENNILFPRAIQAEAALQGG